MDRSSDAIYDEWLILRCQDGEVEALEELVGRWQPRLARHALRLTGRHEAAGDVMQEAWLAMVRGIGRLRDPAGFPAWAYRIVGHKCADWVRRRVRERGLEAEAVAAASVNGRMEAEEPDAERTDDIARLRAGLKRLPHEQRIVLTLHYLEAMAVADIAQCLDVAVGTVKSRLHHARHRLKESLERMERNHERTG
jgi:RNA polymerase sigma-70 factor (ECF subfamily)